MPPKPFGNSSFSSQIMHLYHCSTTDVSVLITIIISTLRVFIVLPVCVLVLLLGYRRWRRQRSFKTTSHSDVFTYHMVVIEFFYVLSLLSYICGYLLKINEIKKMGFYFSSFVFYGEAGFHTLTCVERYLAVVHPVTYLGLKRERGIRIRNLSTVGTWLLCCGSFGITYLYMDETPVAATISIPVMAVTVTSFCNISILYALIRPRPGNVVGEARRTKLRAFYTITAILGAMCLWFSGFTVSAVLAKSKLLDERVSCVVTSTSTCFNLPTSLTLPLLFLHKAGKLPCHRHGNE